MVQSLFKAVKPFNAERHADYFINTGTGYSFADGQPAAPLLVGEFAAASREYTVAFIKQDDLFRPIAVLGLAESENLVVDDNGKWNGEYVPAAYRMYPFVMVKAKDGDRIGLGLAEDYPGLNTKGDGDRLIEEDGELGPLAKQVQEFAKRYAQQAILTDRFSEELSKLEIFAPVRVKLQGANNAARAVSGLYIVDRKKLVDLDPDILLGMVKSGALEAIYLHLASLRNLKDLARRLGHEADVPEDTADDDVTGEDNIFRSRFRN
jgi:hypothetical protein